MAAGYPRAVATAARLNFRQNPRRESSGLDINARLALAPRFVKVDLVRVVVSAIVLNKQSDYEHENDDE